MDLEVAPLDRRRHDRARFACGVRVLDQYLHRLAGQDVRRGVAKVWVLTDRARPNEPLGFYTLSAAQLQQWEALGLEGKAPPSYALPAARIGRLAVASSVQGNGLGAVLLADAIVRSLEGPLGVCLVVVDAKDEAARSFYVRFGFEDLAIVGYRAARWPRPMYIPRAQAAAVGARA